MCKEDRLRNKGSSHLESYITCKENAGDYVSYMKNLKDQNNEFNKKNLSDKVAKLTKVTSRIYEEMNNVLTLEIPTKKPRIIFLFGRSFGSGSISLILYIILNPNSLF